MSWKSAKVAIIEKGDHEHIGLIRGG